MRAARVFRVVAHYNTRTVTRDFLTQRARDRWAEIYREGRDDDLLGYDEYGYVKRADFVEIYDSAPVEWIEGEQWKN